MDDSGGSAGPIIGGLVGVLIVMLVIFLVLDCKKKKKIKEQEEVIQRKENLSSRYVTPSSRLSALAKQNTETQSHILTPPSMVVTWMKMKWRSLPS